MKTFDATVNFESTELETVLTDALAQAELTMGGMKPLRVVMSAVVREDSEEGELYVGDEDIPTLTQHDWCVTAHTVEGLAAALRALL